MINPRKVITALKLLKKYGHPYYQFITDLHSYQTRCEEQDQEGHDLLFGSLKVLLTSILLLACKTSIGCTKLESLDSDYNACIM